MFNKSYILINQIALPMQDELSGTQTMADQK